MQFQAGDVAVVTGPLEANNGHLGPLTVGFIPGEVVDIVKPVDWFGTVTARGRVTGIDQLINETSLTPFAEVADDPQIDWTLIHDYVHEEDNE